MSMHIPVNLSPADSYAQHVCCGVARHKAIRIQNEAFGDAHCEIIHVSYTRLENLVSVMSAFLLL